MDAYARKMARMARHDADVAEAEANRMARRGRGPAPFTPREIQPFIYWVEHVRPVMTLTVDVPLELRPMRMVILLHSTSGTRAHTALVRVARRYVTSDDVDYRIWDDGYDWPWAPVYLTDEMQYSSQNWLDLQSRERLGDRLYTNIQTPMEEIQ